MRRKMFFENLVPEIVHRSLRRLRSRRVFGCNLNFEVKPFERGCVLLSGVWISSEANFGMVKNGQQKLNCALHVKSLDGNQAIQDRTNPGESDAGDGEGSQEMNGQK
jgi:hypothetical protein